MGWISIKGGQLANLGRSEAVEFNRKGQPYSPHLAHVAQDFGIRGERVETPSEVGPAIKRALATNGPAVVEIMVARNFPDAGITTTGWWDTPVPAYHHQQRTAYEHARAEEQV